MPVKVIKRLLLVVGVAITAFLCGFHPIQRGPFEEFRVEMILRYRLPKPASELVKPDEVFEDVVKEKLEKALEKQLERGTVALGSPEVVGGATTATLVIKAEASTMTAGLRTEDKITKTLRAEFPGTQAEESHREAKGKKPAFVILGLGFFKPMPVINLGLDLKGGVRVVLQCRRAILEYKLKESVGTSESKQAEAREKLNDVLRGRGLGDFEVRIDSETGRFVTVYTQAKSKMELSRQADVVSKAIEITLGAAKEVAPPKLLPFKYDTVNTVVEIIRRRVDAYGVAEPQIYSEGSDRVVVELPGLKRPEEALQLIGTPAVLEWKLVPPDKYKVVGGEEEEVNGETRFEDMSGKPVPSLQVYIDSIPIVKGEDIKKTAADFDEVGQPVVNFELKPQAAKKFAYYTRKYVGKNMAIWFDRKCVSAPVIREPILGGYGQISGGFEDLREANNLKILLDAGALPVPVSAIWTRAISPTLGRDTIHKSVVAGIIGLILVLLFMPFYYRLPGVLATFALLLYALIVLGVFGAPFPAWSPTLTLPGIIGFLLSVGMAVDANILIFERLKEELRLGKSLRTAIELAFTRAWTAILDSNVTTLIAAVVLYWLGTGPVKGFALTLSIGVLASMFSAIVATKMMLDVVSHTRLAEKRSWFMTLADTKLVQSFWGLSPQASTTKTTS